MLSTAILPQNNKLNWEKTMDSVIKHVNGFFGGLATLMLAILPVTILWQVLTGTNVFGMDVIVNSLGNGGFVGLVVLVIIASFFMKK